MFIAQRADILTRTTVTKIPDDIQSRISGTIEAALSKQKRTEESPKSLGLREISPNPSEVLPLLQVAKYTNQSTILNRTLDRICASVDAIQDLAKNIPKDEDQSSTESESQSSQLVLATKSIQKSLWLLLSNFHVLIRELL